MNSIRSKFHKWIDNTLYIHLVACTCSYFAWFNWQNTKRCYGWKQQKKCVDKGTTTAQPDTVAEWKAAKAIEEKRKCYRIWHKTKTVSDRNKHKKVRRNERKTVTIAQEKIRKEFVSELESTDGKKNVHRITKQLTKFKQDIVGGVA